MAAIDTLADGAFPRGAPGSSIEYVTALPEGGICRLFRAGARAVTLLQDARVEALWKDLVQDRPVEDQFWQQSVFELARNHSAGEMDLGDVLRFAAGRFGHLARKTVFWPDETGSFRTLPAGRCEIRQETLQLAWELIMQVHAGASPGRIDETRYAASIELLKYPASGEHLQRIFDLLRDCAAAGPWARLGQRVDAASASACGPFRKRFVRGPFAWLSLFPGIGHVLRKLNECFGSRTMNEVGSDEILVGPPHTDGCRYLTMLTGERNVVRTEVYGDGTWAELPVRPRALSIIPGNKYEGGAPATLHRYIMKRPEPAQSSLNLTLLMGVVPRPNP